MIECDRRWQSVNIMKLWKVNYFHTFKLLKSKYSCGLCSTKSFSQISAAGDEISSENKFAPFVETRLNLWNKLKAEYDESFKSKASAPINVSLEYGRTYDGLSWKSTPYEIFSKINKNAMKTAIIAKVNNELWDLSRPLETDCQLELLTYDSPLAKSVLWHSSAHILGSALETIYGCLLHTGPATNNGFFYDIYNNDKIVSSSHLFRFLSTQAENNFSLFHSK